MKRLPLILILCAGISAPLAATLLFYFAPPQTATARGEILPPRQTPAPWALDGGKWTLLFADNGGGCGATCQKRLCQMHRLRLMLPGHYLRMQRAWLRPNPQNNDAAESDADNIAVSSDCGEARAAVFAAAAKTIKPAKGVLQIRGAAADLPAPAAGLAREDYLYLIDPSGVWAMRFAPRLGIYDIRQDLARILKLSKGVKRAPKKGA
ncbi:MAG: hypothetical protein ACR2P5_05935 [Gammaproteobacteria bacterium]